jgi:hypothetical protein
MTEWLEYNSMYRTARTGQPGQDKYGRKDLRGHPRLDIGHLEQNNWDRTGRVREDQPYRTAWKHRADGTAKI